MNGQIKTTNRKKGYRKTAGLVLTAVMLAGAVLAMNPADTVAGPRGGGMGGPPEEMGAMLAYRLRLTDEQQEPFRAVMEENSAQRRELWEKYQAETEGARQEHRQAMETLDDNIEARLAEVLTEEQMEEFRRMREARESWRGERGEHRRGFGGGRPF